MFIKQVAVIGAGTMGADIAYVIANAGIPVVMRDVANAALDRARAHISDLFQTRVTRGKLAVDDAEKRKNLVSYTTAIAALSDSSLVIEAVSEQMSLKKRVFAELDQVLSPIAIMVSNTSALSISELASVTSRPERVAGFHFFFPAHMMRLIEVIAGDRTSPETLETLRRFAEEIRKIPVLVKECPGFVVNRVLTASMAEVLRFQEETGVSYQDIDQAITKAKLAPMGPFVLADALGLDVALEVSHTLTDAYGDRFVAGSQLQALVDQGHLGLKSGQGFYSYR